MHWSGWLRVMVILLAIGLATYLTNGRGWPFWEASLVGVAAIIILPVLLGVFLGIQDRLGLTRRSR